MQPLFICALKRWVLLSSWYRERHWNPEKLSRTSQATQFLNGKDRIQIKYVRVLSLYFTIMRNAGLEETQAGIKIAGRNINNLRYADDTTLMAESEEEPKSLLMKKWKWRVKKLA